MLYNEFLINVMKVIEKVNLKNDNNYKTSDLFKCLYDLLNIEIICSNYLDKIDSLSKEELKLFEKFGKIDNLKRKEFIEEYEKKYDLGKINKNKFLKKYTLVNDYIAAVILNEAKTNIINKEFIKSYNDEVANIYSLELLNNYFFNDMQGKLYSNRKLYNRCDNLSYILKKTFKEYELLSKIYKKEGANFLINYYYLNNSLSYFYKIYNTKEALEKTNVNEDTIEQKLREYSSFYENHNYDFMDLFMKLEEKYDVKYNLFYEIIKKNGIFEKYINKESNSYEICLVLYNLLKNKFYLKIIDDNNFNDISGIMNKMFDCKCSIDKILKIALKNDGITFFGPSKKLDKIIDDIEKNNFDNKYKL